MPRGDKAYTIPFQITEDLTLPKVLLETAKRYGDTKVAMREKEFGIWRPITWKDYLENVKNIALGLVSLGLKREDKVAMIGDNRPEGLWMEMATLVRWRDRRLAFSRLSYGGSGLHHQPFGRLFPGG